MNFHGLERSLRTIQSTKHLEMILPMIETGARSLRLRREVDKQQETAPAPLLQKKSPVWTGHGAIYSGSFQNDRETLEVFHG